MGPIQAVANGLLKFPIFTGRASRSEFWWFAPVWAFAAFFPFGTVIFTLIAIAVLAVCAIIAFVIMGPLIGQMILPSTPGPNHYGPNPNEVPT